MGFTVVGGTMLIMQLSEHFNILDEGCLFVFL